MSSKFLDYLFGYESAEEELDCSLPAKIEKNFRARLVGSISSSYAKRLQTNPLLRAFTRLGHTIASAPIKSYGATFLAFGLITLIINFANFYFKDLADTPASAIATGIVFSVIAIPLLFIDTPIVEFLQKWAFTDVLFFDILCLRRLRTSDRVNLHYTLGTPFLIGTIFAIAGFFLTPTPILIGVGAIIFFVLAMSSPEFSLMMTLLILPLVPLLPSPTLILTALIGVSALSFFLKVALGKRLFHFEQYDAVLLLFLLFTLISGLFNKGFDSFAHSVSMIVLALVYIIVSNVIVNRRLADNAVNIIIFSSVPTAIYAIIQYSVSSINPSWLDPSFLTPRATATFDNPNIYAVFLLVCTVFSAVFALDKGRNKYSIYYVFAFLLNTAALILTWTRGAWLALILSLIAFALIRSRRAPKLLLILTLSVPVLIYLIPEKILQRFLSILNMSDTSIASRLSVWRSSLEMFKDNLFTGIGIGPMAFEEEFLKYAEDGVTAPHSHNLFLEVGCEIGVFALLLFAFILLIRIRHRATYAKYVRNSSVDSLCTMSGTALFALLAFGMTDYIWYNSTMFVLFFIVFGIGSATLRISKAEYDEALTEIGSEYSDYSAVSSIAIAKNE